MSSEPGRQETEAGQFLSRLSSVQVVTAAIGAQLVPFFLAWKIATPLANVLALLLTLAIVGGAYRFWRSAQRRQAREADRERRARDAANRPLQAAFRGLYSYTRRDELPGKIRRQLAKRIATQVAHPTFNYGVVSGEVGAGKSSLLDSGVARELENGGFSVVLVRGLQEQAGFGTPEMLFESIRKQLETCAADPVLIFDQFEEALIEWPSVESRRKVGTFLRQPLPDRRVRVVCGLRSDYLLALHDLSADLPDPTSSKTLFPIKNLDEGEASEVILECAERDGYAFDEAFAKALAADLSRDGKVRPPELQLVCIALETSAPERSYRLKGGSEGILSAYVEDAVAGASAPDIARRALRALCNFTALPPAKTQPKTVEELSRLIPNRPDDARLEEILRQLADAGLLSLTIAHEQKAYALVHDYLVQPIAIATSDATTETERATQLLRLHLTEYSADPKSRIPRRRLRSIRRHADQELLGSANARDLIRRSTRAARIRTFGVTIFVIAVTTLLVSVSVRSALNALKTDAAMFAAEAAMEQADARQRQEAQRTLRDEQVRREELSRIMMVIESDSNISPTTRATARRLLLDAGRRHR